MYKNVSYPKQRSLLVLYIFVLPSLLTRVFSRSGNSLPDFLPGRLPGFLPEIVPDSLPESLSGTLPECVTRSFSRVLPGHVPNRVNPALPESLPGRVKSCPITYPVLLDFLTRPGKFLPDHVPGLTQFSYPAG
jgi:hypothetical protein